MQPHRIDRAHVAQPAHSARDDGRHS